MTTHELLLLIANAVICSAIAIRVGTFRRNGSQHRRWGGWIAYFLIVASASIPVRAAYAIWYHTPMVPLIYQKSSSTLSCLPPF